MKKINWPVTEPGSTYLKINFVALWRAWRMFKRLLKQWRKKDVLEKETTTAGDEL